MVVASKNSMRTSPIYFLCVQLEQIKMSPFSFSLSHTLTVFLSIFRTAPLSWSSLFCVTCSLWNSHKNGWNSLCFNSLFCFSSHTLGRMAFASFFAFSSACPTRFATLLNNRSQTMLFASPKFLSSFSMLDMLQSVSLRGKADLKTFGTKLINELWQGM